MKTIFKDLLAGKFAITYTLTTLANMVSQEIRFLSRIPVLGPLIRIGQFCWFITKIIFFAMVISWFKPQYNHGGAKIALFLITVGVISAVGMMKKEIEKREGLK